MNEEISRDKRENQSNIKRLQCHKKILNKINEKNEKNFMVNNALNNSYAGKNKTTDSNQGNNVNGIESNLYNNFNNKESKIIAFNSNNNKETKNTIPSIFNNIITLNHHKIIKTNNYNDNYNSKTIEQGIYYF
jgi:hypothetical protein